MTTSDTKRARYRFTVKEYEGTAWVALELSGGPDLPCLGNGFLGLDLKEPTYKEVCLGITGHAEVIQVQYDPGQIQFEDLLEVFWKTHDPTTLNRQGADEGTQYRSVIFYRTDEQKKLAENYKQKLDDAGVYDDPIVTEISPASVFYAAEDDHQNYFNLNPHQGYCSFVIRPKIEKLKSVFADRLKP